MTKIKANSLEFKISHFFSRLLRKMVSGLSSLEELDIVMLAIMNVKLTVRSKAVLQSIWILKVRTVYQIKYTKDVMY